MAEIGTGPSIQWPTWLNCRGCRALPYRAAHGYRRLLAALTAAAVRFAGFSICYIDVMSGRVSPRLMRRKAWSIDRNVVPARHKATKTRISKRISTALEIASTQNTRSSHMEILPVPI